MKIGFDAKRLFNNFTGLGNYSRFVLQALLDKAPENQYYLFTPGSRDHAEIKAITEHKSVSVVTPPSIYQTLRATSLWRTWGIARNANTSKLDVFHGLSQELPANLPQTVRKIVTVHDLIYIRYPMLYNPIDVAIYKAKVKSACSSADKVIAISQQTADDLKNFLKVPESKIAVVYQGCHPQFKNVKSTIEIDNAKKKYNLPDRYVLNVGTIEARKNIKMAVEALGILPTSLRLSLVIIGRETAYKKEVLKAAEDSGVRDLVLFRHGVSFSDFPAIYQGAQLFVYPSLFEGFGIPLVEAIASGLPVITSTGSCFREAAGPESTYVEPGNIEEMALRMTRILSDRDLKQRMVDSGKKFIERFEPAVIASDLLSIYKPAI